MKALLRSLVFAGVQYGVAQALVKGEGAKRRFRFILRAVILLALAAAVAGFAGIFLLASLFFGLAQMSEFIRPALITALVAVAVAIGLAWEGWRQIKK